MKRAISALSIVCGLAVGAGPVLAQDIGGDNRSGPSDAVQQKAPTPGPATNSSQPIGGDIPRAGTPAIGGDASDAVGNPGNSDDSSVGDTPAAPDDGGSVSPDTAPSDGSAPGGGSL